MLSRSLMVSLCVLVMGVVPVAGAQQTGMDLAKARNCMACHNVDKKVVGPALSVIGERFAGTEGAQNYLAQSIRQGGRGRWGAVPMPAQPQVSEEDAQLLAAWILSLAKNSQPESGN